MNVQNHYFILGIATFWGEEGVREILTYTHMWGDDAVRSMATEHSIDPERTMI